MAHLYDMPWKSLPEPSGPDAEAFMRENKKKARFFVDECLGCGVTELLRDAGWNVDDVWEAGLRRHPDENVFAYAQKHDRMLLTHNVDFSDDRKFPPDRNRNPGVIVLPGASGGEAVLIRALGQVLSVIGIFREIYRGSKTVVSEDGTFIVSSRNIETGKIKSIKLRFTKHRMPDEWVESRGQRTKRKAAQNLSGGINGLSLNSVAAIAR
jgi:hypothetical protein